MDLDAKLEGSRRKVRSAGRANLLPQRIDHLWDAQLAGRGANASRFHRRPTNFVCYMTDYTPRADNKITRNVGNEPAKHSLRDIFAIGVAALEQKYIYATEDVLDRVAMEAYRSFDHPRADLETSLMMIQTELPEARKALDGHGAARQHYHAVIDESPHSRNSRRRLFGWNGSLDR